MREETHRIVSIHAPARGATRRKAGIGGNLHVSIHAPARGATSIVARPVAGSLFQSTRPRGARQN